MTSILILPLLAFVAADSGVSSGSADQSGEATIERVFNGSEVVMNCPPAELLVRTHMAPDFEHPQLVRRLDWFQEEVLVASFQQDVLTDISQQWWVASTRLELRKPFYQLRISPVLPHDSGDYECRLETDLLFAMETSSAVTSLIVMVKPVAPSRPRVGAYSDKSLTLNWNQSVGIAHRPIVRYSIMFGRVDDQDNVRIVSTTDNRTTSMVEGLVPNTDYSFSVRAENQAGESEFGQELVFKTSGQAPKVAPIIASTRNASSVGCVEVEWKLAETIESEGGNGSGGVVGYRIMVHRLGDGAMREWYVRGKKRRHLLCSLTPFTTYTLSLESDNTYGYSPPATTNFKTDQAAPAGPPQLILARTLGPDAVMAQWQEPSIPNGIITSYQIYYRELTGSEPHTSRHPIMIRLLIGGGEKSKSFAYNITKLAPRTQYRLRMSASSTRGESEKSAAVEFSTDRPAPFVPTIVGVYYDCTANTSAVRLSWLDELNDAVALYKVALTWGRLRHAIFNTSERELVLSELAERVNYTVRVSAVVESAVDAGRLLEGPPSQPEVFTLQREGCKFASSLCNEEATNNCLLITAGMGDDGPLSASSLLIDRSPLSLLLLLSGVLITVSASLIFTWYIRRRCSLFKDFIGKVEKKGGGGGGTLDTQPEIISLVNESLEPIYGQTVTIAKFNDYCSSLSANSNEGYRSQFQELELDTPTVSEGELASLNSRDEDSAVGSESRSKNRYLNIQAAAHSRIRIRDLTITDDTSDGYINANYIDSCDSKNAYIATQAPLPHTLADFWAMVWQEKCNLIISLTNMVEGGKRKCDRYWPSIEQKSGLHFGQLHVALSAEHVNSVFTHRIMELRLLTGDQSGDGVARRVVHQLHFTSWTDHSVPDSPFPFLYFLNYASEIHSTGPVVVHCSAGVGRSGSFILIDSMRRHLLQCDRINIQAHLRHIRRQRSRLVQTLEQYIFCHDVLCMLVRHGITRQPLLNYPKYVNFLFHQRLADGRTRLQMQYEDVCKCPHSPACGQRKLPNVALPGYHLSDEFIVCNWPMPCDELWSTCWEFRCRSIVLVSEDGTDYLAAADCEPAGLAATNRRRFMGAVSRRDSNQIVLTNDVGSTVEELAVTIICVRETDIRSNVWKEIERIQASSLHDENTIGRTIIVDSHGGDSAFALCALQSIACQLEQERYCDLLLYLTNYHHISCACWSSQAAIEFVYTKVLQLVEARRHS